MANVVEGDPKAPFSIATTPRCRALLLSQDCSTLPLIRTLYCWVLSKEVSSIIFKVFGMTRPGIEPRSLGPLANTLPTRPMSRLTYFFWSRGGSNDYTTRKWMIRNILKENSTFINDSWAKPLLSLTKSLILPFLVTVRRDCAEESLAGICHMRAIPSVEETPQLIWYRNT